MKIIIGKFPNEEFKVIGDSGTDITNELSITGLSIDVRPDRATEATFTLINVEVEATDPLVRVTATCDQMTELESLVGDRIRAGLDLLESSKEMRESN